MDWEVDQVGEEGESPEKEFGYFVPTTYIPTPLRVRRRWNASVRPAISISFPEFVVNLLLLSSNAEFGDKQNQDDEYTQRDWEKAFGARGGIGYSNPAHDLGFGG